jgi:hypothetical protein
MVDARLGFTILQGRAITTTTTTIEEEEEEEAINCLSTSF